MHQLMAYNRFYFITICFVLFTLFSFASCTNEPEQAEDSGMVLASVGDFEIDRQHYLNELRRFNERYGQGVNLSPDVMRSVLNSRVNRYTVVEFAKDKGWHQTPEAQHTRAMIERKSMMEEFERRFIHDHIAISENDLRDLYYRLNTSLRASHLHAHSRAGAEALLQRLEGGESFEALAAEVFQSPELAGSGGDLGFFTVDDMDISFEDRAYRMNVGDISEPVQTSTGYSIIKLTEKVETPVLTETGFANKKEELGMIARSQQRELSTRAHLRGTIEAFDFDEEALAMLWEVVEDDPEGYFTTNPELNRLPLDLSPELAGKTLGSYNGFIFTADDFLREGYYSSFNQRQQVRDKHTFIAQTKGMAYRAWALSAVREHPDYNAEYVRRTAEETFYNYLNERFNQFVEDGVEISDEAIRREYQAHPEYYVEPLQLDVSEIVVTSEQAADEAWAALQAGEDFIDVLRRYSADPEARQTDGRLGFIPIDDFGMMGPSLGNAQPGEYAGPFQITGARFNIFYVHGRIEPRQLSYEEAVPKVRRALHAEATDERKMSIIREARTTFGATVYTDRLLSIPKPL